MKRNSPTLKLKDTCINLFLLKWNECKSGPKEWSRAPFYAAVQYHADQNLQLAAKIA